MSTHQQHHPINDPVSTAPVLLHTPSLDHQASPKIAGKDPTCTIVGASQALLNTQPTQHPAKTPFAGDSQAISLVGAPRAPLNGHPTSHRAKTPFAGELQTKGQVDTLRAPIQTARIKPNPPASQHRHSLANRTTETTSRSPPSKQKVKRGARHVKASKCTKRKRRLPSTESSSSSSASSSESSSSSSASSSESSSSDESSSSSEESDRDNEMVPRPPPRSAPKPSSTHYVITDPALLLSTTESANVVWLPYHHVSYEQIPDLLWLITRQFRIPPLAKIVCTLGAHSFTPEFLTWSSASLRNNKGWSLKQAKSKLRVHIGKLVSEAKRLNLQLLLLPPPPHPYLFDQTTAKPRNRELVGLTKKLYSSITEYIHHIQGHHTRTLDPAHTLKSTPGRRLQYPTLTTARKYQVKIQDSFEQQQFIQRGQHTANK